MTCPYCHITTNGEHEVRCITRNNGSTPIMNKNTTCSLEICNHKKCTCGHCAEVHGYKIGCEKRKCKCKKFVSKKAKLIKK